MTQEKFLEGVDNWCNHRPLLWLALEQTEGYVLEMGCGKGSTFQLRDYCRDKGRNFTSFDNNLEWAKEFGSTFIQNWDVLNYDRRYSVVLVDHAPGEHRKEAIAQLKGNVEIVIVHDTEPAATGYGVQEILASFKYRADVKTGGAWATAVSDTIDLSLWHGKELGGYVIS